MDTGLHVYFWVGRQASPQLKADGFAQAKVWLVLCLRHVYILYNSKANTYYILL